jgi:hypothetical protein
MGTRQLRASLLCAALPVVLAALPATASTGSATSRSPVIGIHKSFGVSSAGWGHARPKVLFNGGDPSGDITSIHWTSWGGHTAHGRGKNAIFKPSGGYYNKHVTIRLRATDLGTCQSSGKRAYRHLYVSELARPGGAFGPWRIWTSYHRNLCTRLK